METWRYFFFAYYIFFGLRVQNRWLYRVEKTQNEKEVFSMDKKTEQKKLKELKKMKKKDRKEMEQNLAFEQKLTIERYKVVEANKKALDTALYAAIDAKDQITAEQIKSKITHEVEELERLAKRQKELAEEIELASRAEKNKFDGHSSAWTTVGAWVCGLGTMALSGFGLYKSHQAFDKGAMVDKGTKGLAERLSGLFSFMQFRK